VVETFQLAGSPDLAETLKAMNEFVETCRKDKALRDEVMAHKAYQKAYDLEIDARSTIFTKKLSATMTNLELRKVARAYQAAAKDYPDAEYGKKAAERAKEVLDTGK